MTKKLSSAIYYLENINVAGHLLSYFCICIFLLLSSLFFQDCKWFTNPSKCDSSFLYHSYYRTLGKPTVQWVHLMKVLFKLLLYTGNRPSVNLSFLVIFFFFNLFLQRVSFYIFYSTGETVWCYKHFTNSTHYVCWMWQ